MKYFKIVLPGIIIIGAFLCWIGLSDAESANPWPPKSGEVCWTLYPPSGGTATVTLAVVRTYKDHYLVHGTITEHLVSGDYVRCLNGNAEIVDNEVIMHGSTAAIYLNEDNGHTELIGGLGYVVLDLGTLDGYSEGINMWYDTDSAGPGEVKYDGTVDWVLTQCN